MAATIRLMTIGQVAEMVNIPVNTLRYWRHRGRGPHGARIEGRLLYREEDVLAWVDQAFDRGAA